MEFPSTLFAAEVNSSEADLAAQFDFADDVASWALPVDQGSPPAREEPTPAQLRSQKSKALNRVAQRRYRERNKAKDHELADHVVQIQKEVDAAEHQRRMLETECKTLQTYLEQQGSSPAPPNPAKECECQDPVSPEFYPHDSKRFAGKCGFEALMNRGLRLTECCQLTFTHQQVMTLSIQDHAFLWKLDILQFYKTIGRKPEWNKTRIASQLMALKAKELMQTNPTDLSSPVGQKIRALMKEKHGYNPLLMQNLLAIRKLETDKLASPALMQEALEKIGLSEEQKQHLHFSKCQYKHTLDQLLQERSQIQASLAELDVVGQSEVWDTNQQSIWMQDHYRWMQLAQALKDNLDKSHCAACIFHGRIWRGKLAIDPIQEARLVVFAYPQYPDIIELVETISRELGCKDELILDVDDEASGLQPAESLPDPAVDRYLPLEEKLTRAITHFKKLNLEIDSQRTQK